MTKKADAKLNYADGDGETREELPPPETRPDGRDVTLTLTSAQIDAAERWLIDGHELVAVLTRGDAVSSDMQRRLAMAAVPLLEAVVAGAKGDK